MTSEEFEKNLNQCPKEILIKMLIDSREMLTELTYILEGQSWVSSHAR